MNNMFEGDNRLNKAYDIIASANAKAYEDIFLISNQVLSKNTFTNNFLKRFLNNERPRRYRSHKLLYRLFIYYIKSLAHFALYLSRFIEFFLSSAGSACFEKGQELTLVDTFFLNDKIRKTGIFSEHYFPGLEDILRKREKRYAYLPVFCFSGQPFELYSVMKIISRDKVPMICEYQLLSISDLFSVFKFIIIYPFRIFRFLNAISDDSAESGLIKYEMLDTIDQVTFYSFTRYLQGKRLAELQYDKIKVISWCENQPIDKNLYKGLRSKPDKVTIYGAQLFLYSKSILNLIIDESEVIFDVVADKILTNGQYYIPANSKLDYAVGPSIRYPKIFDTVLPNSKKVDILVLLPHHIDDIKNILSMISALKISMRDIVIKAHPAVSAARYNNFIPGGARVIDEDTYKLFTTAKVVVSAESGALIEAASLGIPVISVKNTKNPVYNNPLPDYGKGVIWEEADSAEELLRQIEKFEYSIKNNAVNIKVIADRYKEMFFCRPSEDEIIRAFDL